MLLKDLPIGKAFEFTDKKTPLALSGVRGQFTAVGNFIYVRIAEGVCPVLFHVGTGKEFAVVSNTYYRDVYFN